MDTLKIVSEEHRKYLVKLIIKHEKYYGIFGADLDGNETDKLLIDESGRVVVFTNILAISSYLKSTRFIFDRDNMIKWSDSLKADSRPYSEINFDLLWEVFYLDDVETIKDVYTAIGMIEDYANQIKSESLLEILKRDVLIRFKDSCSDFFIWKTVDKKEFEKLNRDVLRKGLSEIYTIIESNVVVL